MDKRLRMLETFYRWYDDIAWSLHPWACEPGCSACCTSSVLLTTLEAAYMWARNPVELKECSAGWSRDDALPPLKMTTNEQALSCISMVDFEEDPVARTGLSCPLLVNDRCLCYGSRPLMCRMMLSSVRCEESGQAEMPSRLLSLNIACMQLVEDLDDTGWSGYLTHVVPHLSGADSYRDCIAGAERLTDSRLRRNHRNPGFLLPPEDRDQVHSWLQGLERYTRD